MNVLYYPETFIVTGFYCTKLSSITFFLVVKTPENHEEKTIEDEDDPIKIYDSDDLLSRHDEIEEVTDKIVNNDEYEDEEDDPYEDEEKEDCDDDEDVIKNPEPKKIKFVASSSSNQTSASCKVNLDKVTPKVYKDPFNAQEILVQSQAYFDAFKKQTNSQKEIQLEKVN